MLDCVSPVLVILTVNLHYW